MQPEAQAKVISQANICFSRYMQACKTPNTRSETGLYTKTGLLQALYSLIKDGHRLDTMQIFMRVNIELLVYDKLLGAIKL